MAYLGNILKHIETHFKIQIHGNFHTRTEIEGIRFLMSGDNSSSIGNTNLLYIGSYDACTADLSGNVLLVNCGNKKTDTRCLSIEEPLEITELFNETQEVILRHQSLKTKRDELFQSLYSGSGIPAMAHVAHTYLNNPVTICDTSFSIVAASPVTRDTENLEEKHGRFYLKNELYQDMADRNIIKHIYASNLPYITHLKNYPYKWVFESIRIHATVVGYICVRGTVREFTEDDLEFIDVFSQMLSIEMQKDASYSHPTGLKYEYFLTELLEGHFEDTQYITSRLLQLERKPMPCYSILILKFFEDSHRQRLFKSYYEQILSILPNCMVVLFHENLTILLPGESKNPFTETSRNKFSTFLQLNKMQAFISYPFTDISKSSIYYRQTEELTHLHANSLVPDEYGFIFYEKYFFNHMLYQWQNSRLLNASIHPAILQIIDYDRQNMTEYARTLRTYLMQNRNSAAAANVLHIHKSTFFYRLNKMYDLFDIDSNNELSLFAYECSFRILDYISAHGGDGYRLNT